MGISKMDLLTQMCEDQTEHDYDLSGDSEYKIVSHLQYHQVEILLVQYEQQDLVHLILLLKYHKRQLILSHEILCAS
jgi:hypothetical protein